MKINFFFFYVRRWKLLSKNINKIENVFWLLFFFYHTKRFLSFLFLIHTISVVFGHDPHKKLRKQIIGLTLKKPKTIALNPAKAFGLLPHPLFIYLFIFGSIACFLINKPNFWLETDGPEARLWVSLPLCAAPLCFSTIARKPNPKF